MSTWIDAKSTSLRRLAYASLLVGVPAAVCAQPPGTPSSSPAFDVVSIKRNTTGPSPSSGAAAPGQLSLTHFTLRMLLRTAYRMPLDRIEGGPAWVDQERYDIIARAQGEPSPEQRQLMLQRLLAERFQLVVRTETREMPVFALVLARDDRRLGPQLRPSTLDCAVLRAATPGAPPALPANDRPVCTGRTGPGSIVASGVTLAEVANNISTLAQRPVVDRTGLSGAFDLDLKWAPGENLQSLRDPAALPDAPSFVTALQEQLGLKLEPSRGSVEMLDIQRVERPLPD